MTPVSKSPLAGSTCGPALFCQNAAMPQPFPRAPERACRALLLGLVGLALAACGQGESAKLHFSRPGALQSADIDEASGLQASHDHPGLFWVHDDDGPPRVWAIDQSGADLGHFDVRGAVNRDWEDIALVPREGPDLLVIGDIGDNRGRRASIQLIFVPEPAPADGRIPDQEVAPEHVVTLHYPDGPRDCESLALDPLASRLLLLTKRDVPARLYAIGLDQALGDREATLEFLGTAPGFSPPRASDQIKFGKRTPWISQPTGMDITADGEQAAVISYRSLYLFPLRGAQDWQAGFSAQPLEVYGPPEVTEEAISYSADGQSIFVTGERVGAPVFRYDLLPTEPAAPEQQ